MKSSTIVSFGIWIKKIKGANFSSELSGIIISSMARSGFTFPVHAKSGLQFTKNQEYGMIDKICESREE